MWKYGALFIDLRCGSVPCAVRGGQVDTSWCYTSEYRATGVYDRVKYTTLYSVYKRTGDPRSWTPAKKQKTKKQHIFFYS